MTLKTKGRGACCLSDFTFSRVLLANQVRPMPYKVIVDGTEHLEAEWFTIFPSDDALFPWHCQDPDLTPSSLDACNVLDERTTAILTKPSLSLGLS